MSIVYSVIGFILAIGILVVVHEFGHYWVARKMGVKVLRFSVGFGRPVWRKRAGPDQTEYVVSALPFGGYVKMLDENEGEVPTEERHRAFNRQSVPRRMAIVFAGPAFNFIFAIVAYAVVFMLGIDGLKPVVGKVAPDSIAARAGFAAGDEIVAVDGKPNQTWDQHRLYLYERAIDGEGVHMTVKTTTGELVERELDLSGLRARDVDEGLLERSIGLFGYMPELAPILGEIEADSAAANAGLQSGDRVLAVNGAPVATWAELVAKIQAAPKQVLTFEVMRGDTRQTLKVVPAAHEDGERTVGRIGAGPQLPELPPEWRAQLRLGPVDALAKATADTWSMSVLMLKMLWKMLTLEVSTKNISGPITIAQYAGFSVQIGFDRFLMFLAVVSISLGVLNLLPIPILDGGHLLFYAIEGIKGSPVSDRALGLGQRFGMAVLLSLMVLAFYNDFVRVLQ